MAYGYESVQMAKKKVTALKVPIQEDSSRCDYVTRKKLPGVFAKMSAK